METFGHGLVSGVAHPVLGFDHLAAAIVVGLCALRTSAPKLAPAGYIGAVLLGCVLAPFGVVFPAAELVIACSLLVLGAVAMTMRKLSSSQTVVLFAFFGLFHGSALGESLIRAESSAGITVLVGYLLGLGLVQYAASLGAAHLISSKAVGTELSDLRLRLAGASVAGIGLFLLAESIEALVLSIAVAG